MRDERDVDLAALWRMLIARRRLVAACTVLAIAAGLAYIATATPIYEASTSIRIDEDQTNLPVLDVLKTLSSGSQVETEMQVLRSRTVAEDVVETLALQATVAQPRRAVRSEILAEAEVSRASPRMEIRLKRGDDGRFEAEERLSGERLGSVAPGERLEGHGVALRLAAEAARHDEIVLAIEPFQTAVKRLRDGLEVSRPVRDANIVEVQYRGPDPALVRAVPNTLAERFIARRDQVRKTEARSTVSFLRRQLDTLSIQLAAAEDALRAFREGQQIVSLEAEATAHVGRLASLQAQRSEMDAERSALAELLEDVRSSAAVETSGPSPYRRLIAFPSLLRNQAASELLRSLAEIENSRAQLLNRRTAEDPDVRVLTNRVRELEEQLRSIATTYLQGLTNQVASLDATLARFGTQLEQIPAKEVQFARLRRQTTVLEEIFTLLQSRMKEAEIAQAVEDVSVRVVDGAILPARPVRPKRVLVLGLATLLGMMSGLTAAFTREQLDQSVRSREEIQALTGVPVLGLIPRIHDAAAPARRLPWQQKPAPATGAARLITGRDPRSPISEAYRSLRTNITFAGLDGASKTLVVTSPTPGDGKTTSSANLAITLAQQGIRALLVDADMRRGVLNAVFSIPREPGLSDVLLGSVALETAVRTIELGESGSMHVLGTGTLPPNPAELLGSTRMQALIERLENEYDAIILDSPPLNVVTDAAVLGRSADGVLLVARAGVTDRGAVGFAIEQLRNVRAPVLGSVLNDVNFERDARYYGAYAAYGSYYRYAAEQQREKEAA